MNIVTSWVSLIEGLIYRAHMQVENDQRSFMG